MEAFQKIASAIDVHFRNWLSQSKSREFAPSWRKPQKRRSPRRLRCNLTPSQEAAAIFRRKFIYEKLHPETKAESFKGNRHTGSLASDNLSFANATSDATGKDRRTVERAAARGEALGDDLNDIAGTSRG
ncbi:MAG: hypothetical protein P4L81_02420 [Candidatus Pacebacteria bacterium]|nr:hypothetical protein [Candidatus Paceibacterota bacterium]